MNATEMRRVGMDVAMDACCDRLRVLGWADRDTWPHLDTLHDRLVAACYGSEAATPHLKGVMVADRFNADMAAK